eukprot:1228350-Ditylum_brightwellii.AAC.1
MVFHTIGEEEDGNKDKGTGNDTVVPPVNIAKVRPDIQCHNCRKKGHFANQCSEERTSVVNGTTMEMVNEMPDFLLTTICWKLDNEMSQSSGSDMPELLSHADDSSSNGPSTANYSIISVNNTGGSNETHPLDNEEEGISTTISTETTEEQFVFANITHIEKKVNRWSTL